MSEQNATELRNYTTTVANKQTSLHDTKDYARQIWYKLKWESLLVPAPTAISIFGQLTLLAQIEPLQLVQPPGVTYKYLNAVTFAGAITQLRHEGVGAFTKSYGNMLGLRTKCDLIWNADKYMMEALMEKDMGPELSQKDKTEIITEAVNEGIRDIQKQAGDAAADIAETSLLFENLRLLATEVHLASLTTQGLEEEKAAVQASLKTQLEARQTALTAEKTREEEYLKTIDEVAKRAEERMNTAVKQNPQGWSILGMRLAEKAAYMAMQALEIHMTKNLTKKQLGAIAGNKALQQTGKLPDGFGNKDKDKKNTPSGDDNATDKDTEDYSDPVYEYADDIRSALDILDSMTTGGKEKTVNWRQVDAASSDPTSVDYAVGELEKYSWLAYGSQKIAQKAKDISTQATKTGKKFKQFSKERDNEEVDDLIRQIHDLSQRAKVLSTQVSLKLGQRPQQAPANPRPQALPSKTVETEDTVALAVRNAQFEVSLAHESFIATLEAQKEAHKSMTEVSAQLDSFVERLSQINFKQLNFTKINVMLLDSIAYLDKLCDSLRRLQQFFEAINKGVIPYLVSECQRLADQGKKVTNAAGADNYSAYNYHRRTMIRAGVTVRKVQHVIGLVADTYCEMYHNHVEKGMQLLSDLSPGAAGAKETFDEQKARIEGKAGILKQWCTEAASGMTSALKKSSDEFERDIDSRMKSFDASFGKILPPAPETQKAITEGKDEFLNEVKESDIASQVSAYDHSANFFGDEED